MRGGDGDMVSVDSTLAQAASAISDMPNASPAVNLTSIKAATVNVTSSFFSAPPVEQLLRVPFRIASQIDRALLYTWNHIVLGGLGINIWAGGGAADTVVGGAGAQAMADAAQPGVVQALADTNPESWVSFFAEAFQASTFKSYWGMLHYLTSRWAFTCFAMVSQIGSPDTD